MGKREQTRTALQTAALELFVERGYDATPTAEIARRAGVSEMTLFRHFASKAAFLVDDPYDPLIAAAIREQPADVPPLRAAVRGIRAAWESIAPPAVADVRTRLRIVAETPSLRGALAAGSAETERAIVAAIVDRQVPPHEADIVAAAVVAGLSAALLAWARDADDDVTTALDATVHALGGD